MNFAGMRIVENPLLTKRVEDWSEVRSPSRAKRRLARGFPQRIKYQIVPSTDILVLDGTAIMHPEMVKEFMRRLSQQGTRNV